MRVCVHTNRLVVTSSTRIQAHAVYDSDAATIGQFHSPKPKSSLHSRCQKRKNDMGSIPCTPIVGGNGMSFACLYCGPEDESHVYAMLRLGVIPSRLTSG